MTPLADYTLELRRTAGLPLKALAKLIYRWRRLYSSPARRISHAIVLILTLLFCCCKSRAEVAQTRPERTAIARGDRVVVEPAAAHFFAGTVLAVEGDRLRVQKQDTGDAVVVALGDVYRLPPQHEVKVSDFAVCERGSGNWIGCRIQAVHGSKVQAIDASGARIDTTMEHVLKPLPVTVLNLKRLFEKASARAEFTRASHRGTPRVPSGWKPAPGERILALSNAEWYSAHVRELEDDAIYVRWADDRVTKVARADVAPEPPYTADYRRGEFVLVRPASTSQPWSRQQVRSSSVHELRIQSVDGDVRAILPRDAAPLEP